MLPKTNVCTLARLVPSLFVGSVSVPLILSPVVLSGVGTGHEIDGCFSCLLLCKRQLRRLTSASPHCHGSWKQAQAKEPECWHAIRVCVCVCQQTVSALNNWHTTPCSRGCQVHMPVTAVAPLDRASPRLPLPVSGKRHDEMGGEGRGREGEGRGGERREREGKERTGEERRRGGDEGSQYLTPSHTQSTLDPA